MRTPGLLLRTLLALELGAVAASGQVPAITLTQAQDIAVQKHPRIASSQLMAQASAAAVDQFRSAYYPTVYGNITGVKSGDNAVLSAGAVTTSSIFSRAASGVGGVQLLTDFGRTSSLVKSARLQNESASQKVNDTRAEVLLDVREAYYQALESESVLKVAQATLELRRLTLRQVSALAQSALRSTLDVSFAQVNVSQAELDLFRAQNDATASHTRLSAAIGYDRDQLFSLADEPLPPMLPTDVDLLIAEALRDRPDLVALQLDRESLNRYADAERRLRNPAITTAAVAGVAPFRDERLPETYAGAGINLNIPVFNGGLFKARREEAESRAAAADKDVQTLSLTIARDVRIAWLEANDAFQRLDVTSRMVAEANEALRLAQARYDTALGSIVELNQAQLNQTSAEITAASAKYEYLSRRTTLDYTIGALR